MLLEELMKQRNMLLCEAIRVLGSYERAEDVIQDAALRCLTSSSITAIHTSSYGFLRRMVRNIALDHWRRTGRDVPMPDLGTDMPAPCADPEQKLVGREALSLAIDMIHQLPEREKHAILQYRLNGRRQTEIAAELGVSPVRVHTLIQRAHQRLATQLDAVSNICHR